MKRMQAFAFILAGFLIAVGVILNVNVAMAQGHTFPSGNPEPAVGPKLPSTGGTTKLTYQGRLTDAKGTAINSSIQVVFSLYGEDDATVMWTSAPRTITPVNGLFTVYLGEGSDPPLLAFALASSAYIGVKVGSDAEMTPHQPLNSVVGHGSLGVVGGSTDGNGVEGESILGVGVHGTSFSGTAVVGAATSGTGVEGDSYSGNGLIATTMAPTVAALKASGGLDGLAMEIHGGIKVTSAGVNTHTPLFIQKVNTTAGSGNLCSIQPYATVIDNPLTNNQPGAILIVTPNFGANNAGVAPAVGIPGVYYDATNQCGKGAGKWVIYYINNPTVAMVNNSMFNVMVVQP